MTGQGVEWVEQLPADLGAQRKILRGLLALCQRDDRVHWLVIGCSLARGAGGRLSDVDVAVGVQDAEFDAAVPADPPRCGQPG